MVSAQPSSPGDSQGWARLKISSELEIIRYLNGQWKPWLLLTASINETARFAHGLIYRRRLLRHWPVKLRASRSTYQANGADCGAFRL